MKHNRITITASISKEAKELLRNLLGFGIRTVYIKNEKFMVGGFSFPSLSKVILPGSELGIVLIQDKLTLQQVMFSTSTKSVDDYGEYENIQISSNTIQNNDRGLFELFKENTNESIFTVNIPRETLIKSIDVYGVNVENLERFDDDFPDELINLNLDIDVLLKFNLNQEFFFTIQAKGGSIILNLYNEKKHFDEYIEMTVNAWGEEYGYRYKYTID